MKIHEYQGKELLREAGVAVPRRHRRHARRRSGRGVQAARRPARRREGPDPRRRPRQRHDQRQPQAARRAARAEPPKRPPTVAGNLLGNKLVTIQTGPEGQTVRQVLVEAGCDIARELYLGIVVDRAAAGRC